MGASVDSLVDELRDAARALDAAVSASGLLGRFTSTRRSRAEQIRLYRAYQSGRQAFPVAAPGFSAHEYGEAFDYVVSPAEYQRDVGLTWVEWGGEWGGAQDVVHFELPGASARARQRGLEQDVDTGFLGGVQDFVAGSVVASLMRLIPGLSRSQALRLLSSPSQLPYWVIEQIRLPGLK
jgi:hypothetical protein